MSDLTPIIVQAVESCRTNWQAIADKDVITPEWWLAMFGTIPLDVENLTDLQLLAIHIVSLQEEINGFRN